MKILLTFTALLLSWHVMAQSKDELFIKDSAKLSVELKQMSVQDQKHRRRESIQETDNRNTERMIAIINTYGYPSPSRFHFSGTAGVILVHAQPRYADTLQKLLDVERTEKRITNNEYAYIIWHLNGRVGIPQFDSNSGIKIKNKRRYKSANIIAEPVTLDSIGH